MNSHSILKGVLFAPLFFLFIASCSFNGAVGHKEVQLLKKDSIVVKGGSDQPELIREGLQVQDDTGVAYGIDFRKNLPFRLNLQNGEFHFLGDSGSGPSEFSQPLVLSLKGNDEVVIYDIALDKMIIAEGSEIIKEISGYANHGVWIRNTYGFFWNGHIIHSLKEPEKINSLNFKDARPIGLINIDGNSLSLTGEFSPTLDDLDPLQKYPMTAFDDEREILYYVFRSDYTVMELDLNTKVSNSASSYKPTNMRTRTISFDHDNAYHFTMEFSKQLNEDRTQLVGIDLINEHLIVVHHNIEAEYLEQDRDPKLANYFGVVYDLPDLSNPREFRLPGKFLGTWGDKLLIEENEDPLEYTIGFYKFE